MFPVGTSYLGSVNAPVQQVTAAGAPFLVPVQPCREWAQMCAILEVPLKTVLCKPAGLKGVGSRGGVKAGLVGPLSMLQARRTLLL